MAYTKTVWADNQSPDINAENLNHIEQGIYDAHEQISEVEQSGGLTVAIKSALLQIAQKVAYIDEYGQDYYDELYDALYPAIVVTNITLNQNSLSFNSLGATQQLTATTTPRGGAVTWTSSNPSVATVNQLGLVTSVAYGVATITATSGGMSARCSTIVAQVTVTNISASYTQSGNIYDSDSIDILKNDLDVTATWSDGTTSTVSSNDYTLSGTLTEGTSVITVSYGDKTTTFNVTVSVKQQPYNLNYAISDITLTAGFINDSGEISQSTGSYFYDELIPAIGFAMVNSSGTLVGTGNGSTRIAEYDSSKDFIARAYQQGATNIIGNDNPSYIKMGYTYPSTFSTLDRFIGLNVLDTTLCTLENYTIDASGNVTSGEGSAVSGKLPINSGYVVYIITADYDSGLVVFYDSSDNMLSRNGITTPSIKVYAVPDNAAYVRFRVPTSPAGTVYASYVKG